MDTNGNNTVKIQGQGRRLLLFVYDALVINCAYIIAIILRFTDGESFSKSGTKYMGLFKSFAPWYTIACLILFIVFHMYSAVWRYAGSNDIKKLLIVNACSCVLYVVGSLLIVGRMPITVYTMGAVIQAILTSIPRLAPRYIIDSFGRTKAAGAGEIDIPMMIVGVGENTRIIQDKLRRDKTSFIRPVCVIDHQHGYHGNTFNGLPVLCGPDAVKTALAKYDIRCVIIADNTLPKDYLDGIRSICAEKNIELRDFVIGTGTRTGAVRIRELLAASECKVSIIIDDGKEQVYEDSESATASLVGNYTVESVSVKDDALCVKIRSIDPVKDSSGEEWIRQYREETGDDISFF